jgi:predicted ThiF/HesA family dinucleotide-utilizing enzyme
MSPLLPTSTLMLPDSLAGGLPVAEQYYADFTARNRGLISEREQCLLRRAVILVAGCGSIGGAVVEPLVRLGAERLVLAEPDEYEFHNLNRQQAGLADVGRNKAVVLAEWVAQVNAHAQVQVETEGITADNATELASRAGLIFDGVDVTAQPALACKYLLHREAKRAGVPVISGYDIAGVQLVLVYDYRGRMPVLGGRIRESDIAELDPLQFLARVVPLRALPVEIFPELRRQQANQGTAFPQLVYSARMFGVLGSRLALDLLAGRPVRRRIVVDVNNLPRPLGARWRTGCARTAALARMAPTALRFRR